jgi:hypothetical protein
METYSAVEHCARCWSLDGYLTPLLSAGPDWCANCVTLDPSGYEHVKSLRPQQAVNAQTVEALTLLGRDANEYIPLPFASCNELPPMAPGSVSILAAASDLCKTAVSTSMIDHWVAGGVPCYVLPLETRAHSWRVAFACHRLGIHSGLALSGTLRLREQAGDPQAKEQRMQISAMLTQMAGNTTLTRDLYVAGQRAINVRALTDACHHAHALGMRLVIVDHIDHVGDDDQNAMSNAIQESKRVLHTALDLAQKLDLTLLLTSQLNSKGHTQDRLSRYAPPSLEHLLLHTYKVQVSESIYGIFRPLDPLARPSEIKEARAGLLEPKSVLWSGRTGLVALKLRHRGDLEGKRVILAYDNGRVRDLTPLEQDTDLLRARHATERDTTIAEGKKILAKA